MATQAESRAFSTGADTFPKMLRDNALKHGDKPAIRKKRYGIWNTHTWKDYYENVKYVFYWMMSEGFQRGDTMGIIGDNDPEWWYIAVATQAAGGVEFGIFIESLPAEIEYFATAADATLMAAKDQEQVDKLLQIRDKLPEVKRVVYWEPKGLWRYDDPWLIDFRQVIELGREYERTHPNLFEESTAQGKGDDVACVCFTSGTTGLPKAAMVSYRAISSQANALNQFCPVCEGEDYFSFLSPAWLADQLFGIGYNLEKSVVTCFAEKPDTVQMDGREVNARFQIGGARMLEQIYRRLQERQADADIIKRLCYNLFMPVGYKVADLLYENKEPSLFWKALYSIGEWLVFRPLRDITGQVGLARSLVTGAILSIDIFRYFQAIGVPAFSFYGLTEAAQVCCERRGTMRLGSAGRPIPGREIRLTDEGEILIRQDEQMFSGYYEKPEATKEVLYDGWYHTGDAGTIDEYGYLFFEDRKSEILSLSNRVKFAPTKIEAMLRCGRYIGDCVVLGNDKEYVSALIAIDLGNVGKFAERNHINYTTFIDLSQRPEVRELIRKEVRKVNIALPESSQIKRFVNMHKEFDPDEAELTRTAKLKRVQLEEKYRDITDAIYGGKEKLSVETPVKYRDGREGHVRATINVEGVDIEGDVFERN